MIGKASYNWHRTEWIGGIKDGNFLLIEFQESNPWIPERIWDEIKKSLPFGWQNKFSSLVRIRFDYLRSSSGKDACLSSRSQEFESPTRDCKS